MASLFDWDVAGSAVVALLWATVFLYGRFVFPHHGHLLSRSNVISFGAGMSVAYVFVHMMPELHDVRRSFVAAAGMELPFEGMGTYFLSLLGFLTFIALHQWRSRQRATAPHGQAMRMHVRGFAAYVWLMAYLLENSLHEKRASFALAAYGFAIAFHFLAVDTALHEEYGKAYGTGNRRLLAAMSVVGWAMGIVLTLPHFAIALLVAFVSGAIVMNSTVMELEKQPHPHLAPMLAGGLLYGMILIPLE